MLAKNAASYRWIIVAVAVICLLLIYGIRHSFAAFFPSILDEFSWTRGATSIMFSLNVLLYGLLAPVAGSLADRWRPKLTIALGVLVLGIGTAGCALAGELWHFYILYGIIMSLGTCFSGAPVMVPAITNWFTSKRRGTAVGIGLAGGALSFSMVTFAEYLISVFGWRMAFVILSLIVVGIVIPLVLLFFRYRPPGRQTGHQSLKHSNAGNADAGSSLYGNLSAPQILKNHRLWLFTLAYFLYMGIANYLVIAHQVIFFIDLGYDSLFAASVAGSVGLFAVLGTFSSFISDWMGREKTFTLSSLLSILSLVILLLQKDASSPWALYLFVFCFGFPMGLHAPTIIAGTADFFHGKQFGLVNGILLMGFGVGGAIGPWLGGIIYDVTSGYSLAFLICIAAYGLACISYWIAAPRKA